MSDCFHTEPRYKLIFVLFFVSLVRRGCQTVCTPNPGMNLGERASRELTREKEREREREKKREREREKKERESEREKERPL